jgi:hypothetical protein
MFTKDRRQRVLKRIGHFPSILAISSVPRSYRTKIKGWFEIIGDGIAHFEEDRNGGPVWALLDEMTGRIDLIGDRNLWRVSSTPPVGYSYAELFVPGKRQEILEHLGPEPLLQSVIDINPTHRFAIKGYLWEKEPGVFCVLKGLTRNDVWEQIFRWNRGSGAKIV